MSRATLRPGTALAAAIALGCSACSLVSLDGLEQGVGGGSNSAATGSGSNATSSSAGPSTTGTAQGPVSSGSGSGGMASGGGTTGDGGSEAMSTGGDGAGGSASATGTGGAGGEEPIITSPCESTVVLDHFDRVNGPLGSDWIDVEGFAIIDEHVENNPDNTGYKRSRWAMDFGPDQEAHVVLSEIDRDGDEQLLIMKIQGQANIEVLYAPSNEGIEVWTCTPSCTLQSQLSIVLPDGARFAARATADGGVKVCVDGEEVLTADITDWPYYKGGGGIGIATLHFDATQPPFAFDDFGGGNVDE